MSTATEVREKPIIFTGHSPLAILDGRKTMTRRVIKPQPARLPVICGWTTSGWALEGLPNEHGIKGCSCEEVKCPWQEGERLWVRETASVAALPHEPDGHYWLTYKSDDARIEMDYSEVKSGRIKPGKTYPSIFMPRWASRITLEITGVRAERLQKITEADCEAEGVLLKDAIYTEKAARGEFRDRWDLLNEDRGFGWDTNPWVWVVSFKRLEATS